MQAQLHSPTGQPGCGVRTCTHCVEQLGSLEEPGTVEESQAFHPHCTYPYLGLPRFSPICSEYQEGRTWVNTLTISQLMSLKSKFNIQKHYQIMFAFFCSQHTANTQHLKGNYTFIILFIFIFIATLKFFSIESQVCTSGQAD